MSQFLATTNQFQELAVEFFDYVVEDRAWTAVLTEAQFNEAWQPARRRVNIYRTMQHRTQTAIDGIKRNWGEAALPLLKKLRDIGF